MSGTIVAFSGEHKYKGQEPALTSAAMNGFPDAKIPKTLKTDPYRILVVADMFQTGFDEPLLHTMYVDKMLYDIKAVQTLSRLNRCHPQKHDTFVLDFANKPEMIEHAFSTYYRTTLLSGETDPNKLYDLMSPVDFRNLIGRVGRISYNLYGNVFLVSEDLSVTTDNYVEMLKQPIPEQSLSIATDPKVLKPIEKKYIAEILKSGSSEIPQRVNSKGEPLQTEESYVMMRKFGLVLLKDIMEERDSLVHREFADFLTPEDEQSIRKKFKESPTLPDDDINTFDMLVSHKDDIEKALGVSLVWSRGDDIKSSKISYQLNGVSIENETDWLQMARFHAKWSKKFYDVIVSYLG